MLTHEQPVTIGPGSPKSHPVRTRTESGHIRSGTPVRHYGPALSRVTSPMDGSRNRRIRGLDCCPDNIDHFGSSARLVRVASQLIVGWIGSWGSAAGRGDQQRR